MKIKAAIFDMDGTLIDSLMLWDMLWSAFGEKYLAGQKFSPSKEDDKAIRTLALKDAMYLIHRNYHLGNSGEELVELATKIMFEFYAQNVKLKNGVREFLEHLANNDVKMCIASATAPELIDVAMQHCDIKKFFPKVFSCGALGKGKEQPDIFLIAMDYLKTGIEDTWVFEDSLTAIETAAKIGMHTVGIYDRFNYGQDKIKEIATKYIADGETLLKLI